MSIRPDDIDPMAIHEVGAFGKFEMEAAAAAIIAYAQHRGEADRGPFRLGQLVDFASDRRNLPWHHPKRLPGEPAEMGRDLALLSEYGWVAIQGREVVVSDAFWERCFEKAPVKRKTETP